MSYIPPNVNGQATSANSSPVVLPNDYASTTTSKIGDGTNSAHILKSDGTAAGQNSQITSGAYLTVNFTTAAVAAVASTDAGNYTWVSVQFTATGASATNTFQVSNDNTNWVSQTLIDSVSIGGNVQTTGTLGKIYQGPLMGRYFRINVAGITSGSTTGTVQFWTGTRQLNSMSVAVSQASSPWTVGSATATGSATPANAHLMGASDGTNLTSLRMASADATSQASLLSSQSMIYNGTNFDRPRNATTASGTTGTGVVAAGGMRLGKTANPTAVTDGQQVEALADKLGKQVVVGSLRDLKADTSITLTSTTTETTLIAAIASTFNDLYGLIIENTSATATEVSFRDVAAGTVRFSIYVPAGDTRGFMLPESAAWKQTTVNTAWTAQCTTSVASIKIAAMYVKNT